MPRFLLRFCVAAAAALVFGGVSPHAQAKTLKWITFKPEAAGDAQSISTKWFVDEFKKRTGGKDDIKMFWGGSVANAKEVPDALSGGAGDIGDIITPYFPDKFPLNNAVGYFIPQPHSTIEIAELMQLWHRQYPQFDQELAKYNLKVIGFRPLEKYGLICNKPIKSIADLKGKRIRTYGFAYPALVHALGGTPVSMTSSDGYEALQRGILDCSPIGPSLAHGWKYDEVAKYYVDLPIGASFGHMIAMNLNSYNALDPQTKAILDGLGREYAMRYTVTLDVLTQQILAGWKKNGVTITHLPANSLNAARKDPGVQAVRQEWMAKAKAAGLTDDEVHTIVDEIDNR
ncbi:MAG TPA: C4-dicarboxylate TRAP transporter substrate-binding protein [Xanthobacteraceae bacterium]|nr:C4-dicarboxylate TRAP transporter substrate-binding protein [Xanthobacteraceae bacterium]